jgi:cyanophycinase
MNIIGKLIIIGGAVDKGSFTETDLDKNSASRIFFESVLKE